MAACAHFAQGWNSVAVPIPELTRRLSALEKACEKINRAYSDIEKSLELQVLITADVSSLRVTLANMVALFPEGQTSSHELKDFLAGATDQLPAEMKETWLIGTPEEVKQQLQIYVELGISHFMLWFADAPDATGMKLFASEVIPQYGIQAE
jgi:alkanesulfonate monooxygenase SsuD/methylene tetrahydromethanopterin reductase-like flavin-dependent oxidoreductase (luciferase family)